MREGRKWIEEALPALPELADESQARVLLAAGILAWLAGDIDAAKSYLNGSLLVCRALSDEAGALKALANLANIANAQGDPESARIDYQDALAIARRLDDPRLIATILCNLAPLAEDCRVAREQLEEALSLHKRFQHDRQEADLLHNLADLDAQEAK